MWLPVLSLLGAVACSIANVQDFVVKHVSLNLRVTPITQALEGTAILTMERQTDAQLMILDCGTLQVEQVKCLGEDLPFKQSSRTLEISIVDKEFFRIEIAYAGPLDNRLFIQKELTLGKEYPFYYTQDGWRLFPCQDNPLSRFTFEASINVPSPLYAILSVNLVTRENNQFHYEQEDTISINDLAMMIGKVESCNTPYGILYGESQILSTAQYDLQNWEKLIGVRDDTIRHREYLNVVIMPAAFPLPFVAYKGLILLNSELITGDQSQFPIVIRAIAASRVSGLDATSDKWLKEGLITWIERRMQGHIFGWPFVRYISERALEKEYAGKTYHDLTSERAFTMLSKLESLLDLGTFPHFIETFLSSNTCISPVQLCHEILEYSKDLACSKELRAFPWSKWFSPGLMPALLSYKSILANAPSELATSWLHHQKLVNGKYAALNSEQKMHFINLLLLNYSRLSSSVIDEIQCAYEPGFSPNPSLRSQWLVLLARTRSYHHYGLLSEVLQKLRMAEHCIPVYVELLCDKSMGRRLVIDTFHVHAPMLHGSISGMIEMLIITAMKEKAAL